MQVRVILTMDDFKSLLADRFPGLKKVTCEAFELIEGSRGEQSLQQLANCHQIVLTAES